MNNLKNKQINKNKNKTKIVQYPKSSKEVSFFFHGYFAFLLPIPHSYPCQVLQSSNSIRNLPVMAKALDNHDMDTVEAESDKLSAQMIIARRIGKPFQIKRPSPT